MLTATDPVTVAVIVIVVVAVFVVSATEVAVTVTVAGEGTLTGGVYTMAAPEVLEVADSVPQAAPVHPLPVSVQVTPLLRESFCTVALILCVWPICTETVGAEIVTETAA